MASDMQDGVERVVMVRVAVYRCSYCPADRACGLHPAEAPAESKYLKPRGVFGDDSNHEECGHMWPRAVADEMARRWNAVPDGRYTPGRVIQWEIGTALVIDG